MRVTVISSEWSILRLNRKFNTVMNPVNISIASTRVEKSKIQNSYPQFTRSQINDQKTAVCQEIVKMVRKNTLHWMKLTAHCRVDRNNKLFQHDGLSCNTGYCHCPEIHFFKESWLCCCTLFFTFALNDKQNQNKGTKATWQKWHEAARCSWI